VIFFNILTSIVLDIGNKKWSDIPPFETPQKITIRRINHHFLTLDLYLDIRMYREITWQGTMDAFVVKTIKNRVIDSAKLINLTSLRIY
jgi:hypothetical protein